MGIQDNDEAYMRLALAAAQQAYGNGEVPVGAVLVLGDTVVSAGNRPIGDHDPSAHAEILALREAGRRLGNYRLPGATVYVTLEPCAMCAMALMHARVARVVYGATDPKTGAAGSVVNLFGLTPLNHHTVVEGGLLATASRDLLQSFFRERRGRAKAPGVAEP